MKSTPGIAATACLAILACASPLPCAAAGSGTWEFRVTLDGAPIGHHTFEVSEQGARTVVDSRADYEVKVLGLVAYRYHHHSHEAWARDCLDRIDATTEDNGKRTEVRGQSTAHASSGSGSDSGGTSVSNEFGWRVDVGAGGTQDFHATCPMTFAYWNPAIAKREALLDPGSGRLVSVRIETLPPTDIDVHGETVSARGVRIRGLQQPIDVWYQGDRWVGLDTTVAGHRRMSYRLP